MADVKTKPKMLKENDESLSADPSASASLKFDKDNITRLCAELLVLISRNSPKAKNVLDDFIPYLVGIESEADFIEVEENVLRYNFKAANETMRKLIRGLGISI